MKIRNDLVLRKVGGTWAVFPIGEGLNAYRNIMKLNDTGAFLWQKLCQEISMEKLTVEFAKEYGLDKENAAATVEQYVNMLLKNNILS